MRAEPEIAALTGLRAFPALLVVLFHFYRWHVPASLSVVHDVVTDGFVAVGMFFVLSGFILTYAYAQHDLRSRPIRRGFWASRIARIYPVYVLSLVIGFAAGAPASLHQLATLMGWTRLALVAALLNAFSHLGMFHLNWAAWSLSVEAFFYLLFPWIEPRLKRLGDGALAVVAALAWVVGLVAPAVYGHLDPDHLGRALRLGDEVFWSWYLKFFPLTHLGSFVIGAVAGRLFLRHRDAIARVMPVRRDAAALAASLGVVLVLCSGLVPYAYLFTDALAPLFAVLVVAVAAGGGAQPLLSRSLASRPVVAVGRASYATYILHVPVFYAYARVAPDAWDVAWLFWPYLGALLVTSLLVYRHVEEPSRRWLRAALGGGGRAGTGSRADEAGIIPRVAADQ